MTPFRTTIPQPDYSFDLSHCDKIFSIGSCFSDNMGSRLINNKFKCLLNPFGILYNPVSIGQNIMKALDDYQFVEKDVFHYGEHWHSYSHSGQFSQSSMEEALAGLQQTSNTVRDYLKSTNRILCTLGSSMVYEHLEFGGIVANCHKLPTYQFNRRRLKLEEVVESLLVPFRRIKAMTPDLEIIMTVSPVRHGRDGMHVNQKSKGLLLLACEEITRILDFVHYFPAYEIQLDDLRDYRFYKPDMLHPNQLAVDYIWQFLGECLFTDSTNTLNNKVHQIIKAIHHRPLKPGTKEHYKFIQSGLKNINQLENQYSFLTFKKERDIFNRQLQEFFKPDE